MFTSRPIGFVSSPYRNTSEIPKGLGARHEADGLLKILPEFEAGIELESLRQGWLAEAKAGKG
jgi:tRNA (Thr-GGU) A37 N-methylase